MDASTPSSNLPNPNLNPVPLPSIGAEQLPAAPVSNERPAMPAADLAPGAAGPLPAPPGQLNAADPMSLAMAQPTPPPPVPAQPSAGSVPMPNLAADVDVIEPEWVDKVEDVVRQHLGDPYGEEEAVETVQEDYLQKRYGFTVHKPGEDTTKANSA